LWYLTGKLAIDSLISEVGEVKDAVMSQIVATTILMNSRSCIELAGDGIGRLGI
jgi:hypothetical protein